MTTETATQALGALEILLGVLIVLFALALIDVSRSITVRKFARRMDAAILKEVRSCRDI